ncbi:MAG: hypothetical protein F4W90_07050 [Gammaproteobacteria bacterium]|nr:hypothetical protein [Gammaproteobacteria bacterium]
MSNKLAFFLSKVYPYIWPIAFILMGFIALNDPHMHFSLWGLHLSAHNLMWFMMGLAHADIFWRGWCARRSATG